MYTMLCVYRKSLCLLPCLHFRGRSWTLSLAALRVEPESESTESEFAENNVKNAY